MARGGGGNHPPQVRSRSTKKEVRARVKTKHCHFVSPSFAAPFISLSTIAIRSGWQSYNAVYLVGNCPFFPMSDLPVP